jgi:hypothetical protein
MIRACLSASIQRPNADRRLHANLTTTAAALTDAACAEWIVPTAKPPRRPQRS